MLTVHLVKRAAFKSVAIRGVGFTIRGLGLDLGADGLIASLPEI